MSLIVLVCGGRDFGERYVDGQERPTWQAERNLVHATLDGLRSEPGIRALIHGAATGADACADEWARRNVDVPCSRYPAEWARYGKAAGPRRNAEMLAVLVAARDDGAGVCVVAFPGGRGTADMVGRARRAGIRVVQPVTSAAP